jgi:hypothetical protein
LVLHQAVARGDLAGVLGLYPEILEAHPDLRAELIRIQDRALEKERRLAQLQPARAAASQTRCPNCGADLLRGRPDAESITCGFCGTRFLPDGSGAEKVVRPQRYKPRSFIRLGMIATVKGQAHQVIGRSVWRGRCVEWDNEDNDWETTAWDYEEWTLLGAERGLLYLTHDRDGFALAAEFTPTNPSVPGRRDRRMSLLKDERPRAVREHGEYWLTYFEGEFGWVPQPGEQLQTSEYLSLSGPRSKGGALLSVEARIDSRTGKPAEIEFLETRGMPLPKLLLAFERRRELAALQARRSRVHSVRRWQFAAFGVAGLLALAALFATGSGQSVYSRSLPFAEVTERNGVVVGPIPLTAVGAPHRLELSARLRDNSWAWVGAQLLNPERRIINALDGDFWRESGRDSDGAWSEQNTRERKHFRLTEPGNYFVRLRVEPGTTGGNGQVGIRVSSGVLLARYFVVAAILAALLGLSLSRKVRTWDLIKGLPEGRA